MITMDDDARVVYAWEGGLSQTWESVQEDENGNIVYVSSDRERSRRKKSNRITESIRRGLIRYLNVAIDCSAAAEEKDLRPSIEFSRIAANSTIRPTRINCVKIAVDKFVTDYFDQNPISQLCLSSTSRRSADKLTELSGNPFTHKKALESVSVSKSAKQASLQNTILMALSMLKHVPEYGSKELLIIYNSLNTCDPGDIFSTIKEAKAQRVRISVICTVAELYVCRKIAEVTGGTFSVALDASHLSELLVAHTVPPPELKSSCSQVADFIYMGFPKKTFNRHPSYIWSGTENIIVNSASYICPRCFSRALDLPTQCKVCGLQLNSSANIARSYHHLFPVNNYEECVVLAQTTSLGKRSRPSSDEPIKESNGDASDAKSNSEMKSLDSAVNNVSSASAQIISERIATSVDGVQMKEFSVTACAGCLEPFLVNTSAMYCTQCQCVFCVDCDLFVHETLHNCPGCQL